jgi:AraC-like DNA-binding protein
MQLYIKYDINTACKRIIEEQLNKMELDYALKGFGEVELKGSISDETYKKLSQNLKYYGIEIVESYKGILVQKIKDAITEMVYMDDRLQALKISSYLADKLNHRYGYISSLFSEVTYTSIENYIILQKIERAKQLIITNEFTITEIAWKLNYSSVAHLSNQFKNATGLTPTSFQRIINKRRSAIQNAV